MPVRGCGQAEVLNLGIIIFCMNQETLKSLKNIK